MWRQFLTYGRGKADMLYVNGLFPSWRPLAPLALVLGLVVGVVLAVAGWVWPLAALVVAWLVVLLTAGKGRPKVVLAAGIMHLAYGWGLLTALFRRPSQVRERVISGNGP